MTLYCKNYHKYANEWIFMPPLRSSQRHYVFWVVRPSVCTYVRPGLVIALSQEPMDGFLPNLNHVTMYLAELMNWLDFGATGSKVTGLIMYGKITYDHIIIRTDGQITIKLKTCIYLAEPINELSRYWGHEAKGHGDHYVCVNSLWTPSY